MKKIKLFNQEIQVNDTLCTEDKKIIKANLSLRLYIKITDKCNSNCNFCSNKGNVNNGIIDLKKLKAVLEYLKEEENLKCISITGGEPMVDPIKLNDVINLIYDIDENIQIAISTNGYRLKELNNFDQVNKLESIHISRHHYKDEINNKIFKTNTVAQAKDIKDLEENLKDKQIININTLIMKDYINNLQEIKKMLNHVGELNVYKIGFVSLMKVNKYAEKNYINYNDIFNGLDENFFLGHHFYNQDYCECLDGMYLTDKNKIVEFYARMVKEMTCPYVNQLVYTSDNKVAKGFTKQILLK